MFPQRNSLDHLLTCKRSVSLILFFTFNVNCCVHNGVSELSSFCLAPRVPVSLGDIGVVVPDELDGLLEKLVVR